QLDKLNPRLPAYVMIPRMVPGTGSAYLGVSCKPSETQTDPATPGPFKVQNFEMAAGLSVNRLGDRQSLLSGLDKLRREADATGKMAGLDRFGQKAYDMLCSPEAQKAFDLDAEPQKVRDRYGFMPAFDPGASNRCGSPAWSQRILLARRLVEAGVRLVTVDLRWWDTHVKGFESLKLGFLPRFDMAYSALIEDLHERGLMEKTLVVAWGEFGRTPRVNNDAGRDHYPNVFSAAIAGGKVRGGRVVGSSDSHGAFPKDNPKSPLDVLATIYDHLGIDTKKQYLNDAGRPITVLSGGEPIKELFLELDIRKRSFIMRSASALGLGAALFSLAFCLATRGDEGEKPRYIDRGEYIEDTTTKLLWQKDGASAGKKNFQQAADYAKGLKLGGLTGWR